MSLSTLILLQKTTLVFISCGKKIKFFHWFLEAIDYAFAHKNSQLQKIIFQNIQKTMVQQNIFLQCWQDVGILTCSSFHQFKTLSSIVSLFKFSVA